MNAKESYNKYYNIDGSKVNCARRIESQKIQSDIEAFKAAGGKIELVPVGESRYLNDLQKGNKKRYGENK